ncbi:HAD family hydrolase [Candidatus Kaiserbacteria bacterium]|nr:HAD family hydrolase [Candidatus Kaiserbacteria bacterium]
MRKLWTPEGCYPISAVGLDADGVIRDTGYVAYITVCKIIEHFGGKAPPYADFILKEFDHPTYCRRHGAHMDMDQFRKMYYEVHPPDLEGLPFSDVVGFCKSVALMGLDLFVVSSCREDWLLPWFERHSMGAHFAYIVPQARPKDAHLVDVCRQLGVEPEVMMYVGDMGHDMHAATTAGAIPVGITRGHHEENASLRSVGAKLVVQSLEHLSVLIS